MEQAGPQLGRSGNKGMGTAKNPQCEGIPLEQLDRLDWDRIDLREWTGILAEEGALKTGPDQLTFDGLTGSGSALSLDNETWGDRDDVVTRTQDRMANGSPGDLRVQQEQEFTFDPD